MKAIEKLAGVVAWLIGVLFCCGGCLMMAGVLGAMFGFFLLVARWVAGRI